MRDAKKMTALHIALERKLEIISDITADKTVRNTIDKILQLMLNSLSTNYQLITDDWGLSNFHVSCVLQDSTYAEHFLQTDINIDHAINMNSPQWAGYTALHFAALCNLDLFISLAKRRANVYVKNAEGLTPLDMCLDKYENYDLYKIMSTTIHCKNIVISDGKTRLYDIIYSMQNIENFHMFLTRLGTSVRICDSPLWPGFTLLHLAVTLAKNRNKASEASEKMSLAIVKQLCIENNDIFFSQDIHGYTAIHLAFRLNRKPALDLLLDFMNEMPSFVDFVDEDGLSFLHIASAQNNIQIIARILTMEFNVNITYKGQSPIFPNLCCGSTALHFAVVNGCALAVEALMSCGADVNVRNALGLTPIHMIFLRESKEMGDIILTSPFMKEIIVNGIGLSHLHIACFCGNVNAVRHLLNIGADMSAIITYPSYIDKQCKELSFVKKYAGHSALSIAYERHCYSTVSLLLRRGADIFMSLAEGKIMLYEVIKVNHSIYFNYFVRKLKGNQAMYARLQADTGMTSLHIACLHSDLSAIRRIIATGEDVNAQLRTHSPIWAGYTPLHILIHIDDISIAKHMREIIKVLLVAGAKVTIQNAQTQTVIHMMYNFLCDDISDEWRHICINLLLEGQKDYSDNPVNTDGVSHFHIACYVCNADVVLKFLNYNCNQIINAPIDFFHIDEPGYTALHLVADSHRQFVGLPKRLKIIDLLLKHGANANCQDSHGDTPLHKCARLTSQFDLFERLIRGGANPNTRNVLGETPLKYFLESMTVPIDGLKSRLRLGCSLNAHCGITHKGYLGEILTKLRTEDMQNLISAMIVNYISEIEVDYMGRTIIHNIVAVEPPTITADIYISLIDMLSEIEDIDEQDDCGRTALHIAVQFYNFEAIKGLLLAGADINVIDNHGTTALAHDFISCNQCHIENTCAHYKTRKILLTHIKKLQACGLHVIQQNANFAAQAMRNYRNPEILNDHFSNELENAKHEEIEPHGIILYDLLCETGVVTYYPTMAKVKREGIRKFFSPERFQSMRYRFPNLAGLFQLQYRKAIARPKLLELSTNSLFALTGFAVPEISEQIFKLLGNSDLEHIIISSNI
ncbi:serine/threonine-protein phosphatase 6 regulatory ankyrin repeat subunit B-like isoform X2 [Phymastichus coffea]|nr:serine/threonine-protein phosphatase 6 regulatory ankyrin repeat subunit B-like isoform X2 [Phymastichus coffea]